MHRKQELEQRLYLNVKEIFGQHRGSLVNGFAGTIEDTAKHVFRDSHAENVSRKFTSRMLGVDSRCAFEHLKPKDV